jgi:D-hexose-6-phosphate mutarotase
LEFEFEFEFEFKFEFEFEFSELNLKICNFKIILHISFNVRNCTKLFVASLRGATRSENLKKFVLKIRI